MNSGKITFWKTEKESWLFRGITVQKDVKYLTRAYKSA